MIVRLVKLSLQPAMAEMFKERFKMAEEKIRNFPGCSHLSLFRDVEKAEVYFTYSVWESAKHLEKYRISELFRETWSQVKPFFSAPAETWSLDQIVINSL